MSRWSSSRARIRGVVAALALVGGTAGGLVGALSATSGAASTPTISAVSPSTGPTAGSSVVAVTGTNFTGVTGVSVGSTALTSTQYDVVSATRIDLVTPAATSAGVVDITVTNGSGTSSTSSADQFTYTTNPVPDCQSSLSATQNLCEEASGGSLTITAGSITLPFTGFGNSALGSVDLSTGQFNVPAANVAFPNEVGTLQGITADVTIGANGPLTGSINLQSGAASAAANLNIGLYVPLLGDFCVAQISLNATGTVTSYSMSSPSVEDSQATLNASGPLSLATNDGGNGCTLASQLLNGATQQVVLPMNAYVYAPSGSPSFSNPVGPAAPAVTGLAPASGPASGGSVVTVTGSGFGTVSGGAFTPTVTGVSLGSTALTASQYDVVSPTQIDLVTPAGSGSQHVTVTNPQGTSSTSSADTFAYQSSAPSCDGGSLSGSTNLCVDSTGGTLNIQTAGTMALNGSGFGMAALGSVNLGTGAIDIPASGLQFPQVTTSLLGTTVPMTLSGGSALTGTLDVNAGTASASGTVDIGIYVPPLGTFCVIQQPLSASGTIGALTADSHANVLKGTGTLSSTGSVAASSNDYGNGCGLVEQLLKGATDSVTIPYTGYELNTPPPPATPTLTAISPSTGLTTGGNTVTLTGTNLTGASVAFGSAAGTNVSVNGAGTSLTVTVPAVQSAGPVQVTVTTTGGTSNAETYTYTTPLPAAPTLTAISPSTGLTTGGNTVTLTGTNLGGASVAFGSAAGTNVSVNGAGTSLTVTVPAVQSAGPVQVTVTTTGGTSNGETYTYTTPPPAAPTLTAISPNNGPQAGGTTVTLTGTNLTGATSVKFGAASATSFTVTSATQVTATAPAGTGTVQVTVTTGGGTSNGESYTYNTPPPPPAPPALTAISPNNGPQAGGTTVTLTGTNLGGASVAFGSAAGTNVSVNGAGTSLTVTAPAGTGTVQVTATTANGTSNGESYTYNTPPPPAPPALTAISPNNGAQAGGNTVTLTGTNLSNPTAVVFGPNPATNVTVNAAGTSLTATAPAGTGTVQVTVTTANGTSNGETYTYNPPAGGNAPVITGMFPTSGPTQGYQLVWIFGKNLGNASQVTFGGTKALARSFSSNLVIALSPPTQQPGTVDVQVTTSAGTSATTAADQFTYKKQFCILFFCF